MVGRACALSESAGGDLRGSSRRRGESALAIRVCEQGQQAGVIDFQRDQFRHRRAGGRRLVSSFRARRAKGDALMYLLPNCTDARGYFSLNTKWGGTSTLSGLLPGGGLR